MQKDTSQKQEAFSLKTHETDQLSTFGLQMGSLPKGVKNREEMDFLLMDHIVTKIDIIKALMGLGISRAIIVHGFNDGPVVGITTYKQVSRRKISDFMNKAAIGNGCHWDFQYQTEHFFLDRWKKWEYCFIDMDTATETYMKKENSNFMFGSPKWITFTKEKQQ